MKVLIAPCSFKGSLSAAEVARHVAIGFCGHDVTSMPLSDGGEGLLDALLAVMPDGRRQKVEALDPLERRLEVDLGLFPRRRLAVLESALSLGLPLLAPKEREPLRVTSRGLGLMMREALRQDVQEIWIGLGGSATCDGGLGMLTALGVACFDADGCPVTSPSSSKPITTVDLSRLEPRVRRVQWRALCDVSSPLSGPLGAGLYMAQKGATPAVKQQLEDFLAHLGAAASRAAGRDLCDLPGSGAAGGLGMALALIGADLASGSAFVANRLGLRRAVDEADLVITGEGRVDVQTFQGKAVGFVLECARRAGRPVILVCGIAEADLPVAGDRVQIVPLVDDQISIADAVAHPGKHLERVARELAECPFGNRDTCDDS